jgi:uncharacterized RDD family membrane protein YckC
LNTAALFPEWKQEVNRRVAAHLSRKTPSSGETSARTENRQARPSRAAQAAARVAARYANAPTYSEVLAREARAAVQAAEAASKAAQEVQAAFQYVLDGLEAATTDEIDWELPEHHAAPVAVAPPRMTERSPAQHGPASQRPVHQKPALQEPAIAPSWELESDAQPDELAPYDAMPHYNHTPISKVNAGETAADEPFQPIYANLIEFPREMVAARRARPRRAEGPLAETESEPQLSIFEVDPAAISIEPPAPTVDTPAPPAWMRPEWSSITLDAQPAAADLEARTQEQLLEELAPRPAPEHQIEQASMSRRLLAMVVDCTLIVAALVSTAMLAARGMSELPGARAVEFGGVLAFLAIGFAYLACFLTLARATPGMRYASIELNTFTGFTTTRGQRWRRLMAMLLSVLPLGLGVAWALFDDGHMTWHDRLSKTYLRKR